MYIFYLEEDSTVVTPQLESEVMNGNGMPTPHSYGTPHTTTTNKLVGNTFFGPDFNLESYRGEIRGIYITVSFYFVWLFLFKLVEFLVTSL